MSSLVASLISGCATPSPQDARANHANPTKRSASERERLAASRLRTSTRFGYSWTLENGWDFTDASLFWKAPPVAVADAYAAQRSPDGPFVLMVVTDVIRFLPGQHPGDDPKDYDDLERDAIDALRGAKAEIVSNQRLQTFGGETVEVTGDLGELRTSIRLLYVGYRKFAFHCFSLRKQSSATCWSALSGLIIKDLPERPTELYVPRVRHLRDARFGIAYDAPDDSWRSTGPFAGAGGAQVVWIWAKAGQQIDVQVMDLTSLPSQPTQAFVASGMARDARASGQHVVETQTAFAGQLWDHHEITSQRHGYQDLFILVRQGVMYAVLVTQRSHDQRLIDAAKAGFRLIPKSSTVPDNR